MKSDTERMLRALKVRLKTPPAPPPPPPPPPDDPSALFRQATRDVIPLDHPLPYPHPPQKPSSMPRRRIAEVERVVHDAMTDAWPWDELATDEEMMFLRPGQKLDTLRKLRRGHWLVQAELDLHGLGSDEARVRVGEFIHRAMQRGRRCIRIIHGKGYGSLHQEPVLKNKLRNWLWQRQEVLAFSQARASEGGAGAVVVLLRGAKGL